MSRSRVVVMGAAAEDPPPGIGVVADAVDLSFADTAEGLAGELAGADILFAWRPRSGLLPDAWPAATDLAWIQSGSAGVDGLLFPELVESHVVVTNARGVFDDAMAEYVLGLMLLLSKGLLGVLDRQRRAEWQPRDSERLSGQHVLVVGVGPIGRAIGRACRGFGMAVRGMGRTARPGDEVFDTIHGLDELADVVRWADFVVNVLPSAPGTARAFDARVLARMDPRARLINVGRGSTIDEGALVEALREGRIAGAALDVFEREPLPPGSPLWTMPGVVVSPHMSGDFAGWREAVVEIFVENLDRYLSGKPLLNVVDKARGYVPS